MRSVIKSGLKNSKSQLRFPINFGLLNLKNSTAVPLDV
jgi:hypothetical protein